MPKALALSLLALASLMVPGCNAEPASKQAIDKQQSLEELVPLSKAIDDGRGDMVEPTLQQMHRQRPKDAAVLALLARIEYLRAVAGRPRRQGYPPQEWDQAHMAAAERWVKLAVEADAKHANAWVVYGQIKYAQSQLAQSLDMLEHAESLDPSSVKLRLRKGATLSALAVQSGDPDLHDAAVREYSKAITGPIDDGNERLAASEIAEVHSLKGDFKSAVGILSDALSSSTGSEKARLLDNRAKAYLFDGDTEAALADIRTALALMDFGVGRDTLSMVLLVKSGTAMRDGDHDSARAFLEEAFSAAPDLLGSLSTVASRPKTFPAIYTIFEPRMKSAFGDLPAAYSFCFAASYISSDDLKRLKKMGANLDVALPNLGTLLHCAIDRNNVDAVRTLLALGVDTRIKNPNGETLLEITLSGNDPARKEIRKLVLAKVGKPAGWQDPADVALPVKGRWYKAERDIGTADLPNTKIIPAGMTLLSAGDCDTGRKNELCMVFKRNAYTHYGVVIVPMSRSLDLKALREVPPPPEASQNAP